MRIRSLTLGCLAAGLLIGAPQAMAQSFEGSLVVAVDSASGVVDVDSELCMPAVSELVDRGYVLQGQTSLGGLEGPDLSTYLFTGFTPGFAADVVTLYCIADIEIEDPDDPGDPDIGMGPDGMGPDIGMCGGLGMGC